jgi:two-component system, sensor histidine kinase PdtaS
MLTLLRATRGTPLWLRAVISTCAVASAYLFQIPIEVEVPGEPFLLFFVIVMACTLAFGPGFGWLAAILTSFLSLPFFDPGNSLYVTKAVDLEKVELYLVFSASIVPVAGAFADALLNAYAESEASARREREKSLLLTELSHRVGNNFSVISALMRQKAGGTSDPNAKASIDQAVTQLSVMARIHGRLSVSGDDQSCIDSRSFLEGLCEDISSSAGSASPVKCLAVSYPLHAVDAVPLGLIINELITNALKHAFPTGTTGQVEVTLDATGEGLRLRVSDNGLGVQNKAHGSGLGHRLIRALAHQLGGSVQIKSSAIGTSVVVAFDPDRRHVGTTSEPGRKAKLSVVT